MTEFAHRPCRALNHEHHHRADQHHQRCLSPQRVDQQAARQRLAQFQRFCDLDRCHALAGRPGHGLQQHGDPDRGALVTVVVKIDQRSVGASLRQAAMPGRQRLEARNSFAVEASDLVVQPAAVVGLERFECRIEQCGLEVDLRAVCIDLQQFADGFGGGQQRSVVGSVCGPQCLAVQQPGVQHDHRCHRQQDAQHQPVPE